MAPLNRNQRRATNKGSSKFGDDVRVLPPLFRDQLDALAVLGGFANHVSIAQTGLPTKKSGSLASMVFAKCCAHARSIGAISMQSSMFDHHTIMALARMIMEASTMIAYLLDPVAADEWTFRHAILRLHDTVTRIKLLRGLGLPVDDLRAGRAKIKADLEANPIFRELAEDRQQRLARGEEMFAIGMRAVAIKIMGWNETLFNGIYAYLSAHTHSAPMSFMRMADHKIDYFFPSETQTEILGLSIEVATACLRRSMLRMIDKHPEQIGIYHSKLLEEFREQDAACALFKTAQVS